VGGPIPLGRYRRFKKTAYEKRAERIEALAAKLNLPQAALGGSHLLALPVDAAPPPVQPFNDPDPFQELTYPSALKAKQAIASELLMSLAELPTEQLEALDALLAETLRKSDVSDYVRLHLRPLARGAQP
jgi:hypothetical protein